MADQLALIFSTLDREPCWRERLPELAMPALVVHGHHDPFFPGGNGEAIVREIPGARAARGRTGRDRDPRRGCP
jgi:pimeloyl-ACP methyl ester carboxylesterase